jgi:hypothetical protein
MRIIYGFFAGSMISEGAGKIFAILSKCKYVNMPSIRDSVTIGGIEHGRKAGIDYDS